MTQFGEPLTVTEDGTPAFAQTVTVGRHILKADEPEARGGRDAGPAPYDYLLAGLGACTVITIRMYAQRHNWPLVRTRVDLWHSKIPAKDGARSTDQFRRLIDLEGELTAEQRSRLLQIAKHCPVSDTLRHSSVVVTVSADQDVDTSSG